MSCSDTTPRSPASSGAAVASKTCVIGSKMPQLVWWGTLSPQGESNLAALRIEKPMRISSIRIFPKDAQPFKEAPDVVS